MKERRIGLLPKAMREKIFNQHIGTGVMCYKSGESCITSLEFYVDRKDKTLRYIESGTPLNFEINYNETE